jgi:hypothetical protein
MLQFQAGEYCICIWDGEQTRLSRALESLNRYTGDERATQDHQGYTVTVQTFGQGTNDKAQKVLEKASEVQGVLRYEGSESKQALYVLAETVTACLDLVEALGCSEEEFQDELDMVNESNARKEH